MRAARALGWALSTVGLLGALTPVATVAAAAATSPVAVAVGEAAPWGVSSLGRTSIAWSPLSPGSVRSADLVLTNRTDEPLSMSWRAVDVVDEENGCLRQEARSPLEDCTSDAGELGGQLRVSLSAAQVPVFEGSLAELADQGSEAVEVPPGSDVSVRLEMTLPEGSTNETMTDRAAFGLRTDAVGEAVSGVVSPPVVSGELGSGTRGGPAASGDGVAGPRSVSGVLPATGSVVSLATMVLGGLLLAGGASLVRRSRQDPAATDVGAPDVSPAPA